MHITVVNVQVGRVTEQVSIPFKTVVRYSDDMVVGQERVQRAGREGLKEVTSRVRRENDEVVARETLSSRVVRRPEDRVVVRGTREPNVQSGTASWYHRDGMTAAHKTLAFGTRVRVTNVDNGRSVTVIIDDRGPYVEGRIIDLSDDAFAQLAPLSRGTCRVRISW
jgi:rare lipoprotein A